MSETVYPFRLGHLNCAVLFDGSRTIPLRAIFPRVSDDEFARIVSESNVSQELTAGFNVLYLNLEGKHCLIDSGLASGQLIQSLESFGLSSEAIDTLIITHNDGDHIGGLKNFPNAEIILSKKSWNLWTNKTSRQDMIEEFIKLFRGKLSEEELEQRAQSRATHGAETLPSLKDKIRLVEPEEELFSGVKLIYAPGHRTDHYAVQISSKGKTLIHVVDSIRHPLQANYSWASFIDSYPEQIIKTNERLLAQITDQNALVFGAHFPFPALARVTESENKRIWQWVEPT